MKKLLIYTFGVPSFHASQPSADPLLHAIELKKFYNVRIISLIYKNSGQFHSYLELRKKIYSKYKIKCNFLIIPQPKLLEKMFSKIFFNLFYETSCKKIKYNNKKYLNIISPDIVFNFFERTIELNRDIKNVKKINYLSIPLNKVEALRKKFINKFALILNSFLFSMKYHLLINKITSDSEINFISCRESFKYFKEKKINNLINSRPLSRQKFIERPKIYKKEILLIGNLKTTFIKDSLTIMNTKIFKDLEKFCLKNDFIVNIIGRNSQERFNYKNINNSQCIKFLNWVDNIDPYFKNSFCLFIPSIYKLSIRTKILEAMSCGLPIVCYDASIFDKNVLVNRKNILYCSKEKNIVNLLDKLYSNHILYENIKKNSINDYNIFFNPAKILEENIKFIKKKINE